MDLKLAKQRAIEAINAVEEGGDIVLGASGANGTLAFLSFASGNFMANVIATIEQNNKDVFSETLKHILLRRLADGLDTEGESEEVNEQPTALLN